jgi:uncharacterized membrane protein YphA (DoxX/SURF4 family)
LLLRAAVGVTAAVQGGLYLAHTGNQTFGTWALGFLAVATGASLLFGFLTPFAGILAGLGSLSFALSWLPVPTPYLFDSNLSIFFVAIMATVLSLLGPGAFSLDARLFGRREIIIPHTPRSSGS